MYGYVGRVELDRAVGVQPCLDQVLDDFLLPVDGDRAPARERREVDAVTAPAEAELDAVMHEALARESVADAGALQQLDRRMLEHARADPMLDVVAASVLDDDGLDAFEVQEMRQEESGRPRADDADLRALLHRRLHALDDQRDALADADAHRAKGVATAATAELVARGGDEPGAACAERMPERDRAAVRVDARIVIGEPVVAGNGKRLCGKRLVQLDHRHIVELELREREHFAHRG